MPLDLDPNIAKDVNNIDDRVKALERRTFDIENFITPKETFALTAVSGSYTISSVGGVAVNGDTDYGYRIDLEGELIGGTNVDILLRPNGLSSTRHGATEFTYRDSAGFQIPTGAIYDATGLVVSRSHFGVANTLHIVSSKFVSRRRAMVLRGCKSHYTNYIDSDTIYNAEFYSTWADNTTNVTSLVFAWSSGTFSGSITVEKMVA
jgi:hypothetical protein